jgi:ABC-type phosphate transport system substrate-binding protein
MVNVKMERVMQRSWKGIRFFLPFFTFLSFLFLTSSVFAQGVAVIANPSAPSLTREQVKALFLGFSSTLPDGTPAQLIMLKGDGVKQKFLKGLLGISESEYKAHWLQKALAGEGVPPRELTPDEILAVVKTQKGAIGVIPLDKVGEGVKVILEIR